MPTSEHRLKSKTTAPKDYEPNLASDLEKEEQLLEQLKSGKMKSLDQSLLPIRHLNSHNSQDSWAQFCLTCRAAKQRRKAARRDSGLQNASIRQDLKPFGEEAWIDTIDYKSDQNPLGAYRYDLALYDGGTGWEQLAPMRNVKTPTVVGTLREYRRHSESFKRLISDSANQLSEAARKQDADDLPLVPNRPQGNRIERRIEEWGDHLRAIMLHARFIPHLRPLVSRFISDVRNLFRKCDRYYPDEEATHSAVPYFHRFRNDPPWKESELPPFGSLITVVPAKSQRKNEAKLNPRGYAMLFCGIYSKHATYDRSILAVDLEALVTTGKAHVRRTRDWRIPPGPPKFPLSELATQLSALRSGKKHMRAFN